MERPELLPCPFCGAEAETYSLTVLSPRCDGDTKTFEQRWFTDCTKCDCNVSYEECEADSIETWNTRYGQKSKGFIEV